MYKLNPKVDDIPDSYAVNIGGIKVLVAGAVKKGGSGCYCPENAFVRTLVSHLLLDKDTALVVDMEAGVEHLGRGTVGSVDRLLIVVEPGRRSVETAFRIRGMAADIGLKRIACVANRIRSDADLKLLRDELGDIELIGSVPYDEALRDAEVARKSAIGASAKADKAIVKIVERIESEKT
jgi:CO dehydrogenase maturation factor